MGSWRDLQGSLGLPHVLSVSPGSLYSSAWDSPTWRREFFKHTCKYFPEMTGTWGPGSVLRVAPSCCVTPDDPIDLSGHPAPPIQVRGGATDSFGLVSQQTGQAHSALRTIGTPRKVLSPVIPPGVEVSSPQLLCQHSSIWKLLDWRSESARQRIQSPGGASHLEGESTEEVPGVAKMTQVGLTKQLCSGLWPRGTPVLGCSGPLL